MIKLNKKILAGTGILIGILILFSGSVFAFAVSSAYWKEYPLEISPGETQDISVTLQNMAGTEEITLKGDLSEDSQIIAEITDTDNIYSVPAGEKTKVNIRVTIPEDTELDTFNLILSFSTVTKKTSGEFGFGSSIEHTLPVKVIKEPKTGLSKKIEDNPEILTLLLIAIIVLVIAIIIKKRKK